jgi:hypothetical protein
MGFKSGGTYRNSRSLLPGTAVRGAEDIIEKKCDNGVEATTLANYLLLPQAELNSSQVTQTNSSLNFNTLLRQDHEMLDGHTLPYAIDVATPLLTTHSLTKSLPALPSPPNSQEQAIENAPTDCDMASITSELSCAQEMAHLAFRKLVGGRQNKSQPGIKFTLRRPTLTLSELAPGLFSPGFAEVSLKSHSCLQII